MAGYVNRAAWLAFSRGPAWLRRVVLRWTAAQTLRAAAWGTALADELVLPGLRDPDVGVRLAALAIVANQRRGDSLNLMWLALRDRDELVRAAATHALGQFRSVRAGDLLRSTLHDPHPDVRVAAALALGRQPSLRASEALEAALADEDGAVRGAAARALERVGRAEAVVPLQAMAARDTIDENRRAARQAMAGVRRRTAPLEEKRHQAGVELVEILADVGRPSEERQRAKACLLRIGRESLAPVLDAALRQADEDKVRVDLLDVLAALPRTKQQQAALIRYLHHISPLVRRGAMRALARVGDEQAIYYLNEVAGEGDQPGQLLTRMDAVLARAAVRWIRQRAGQERERLGEEK